MRLRKWLCRVFGHPPSNRHSVTHAEGGVEHVRCGRCGERWEETS